MITTWVLFYRHATTSFHLEQLTTDGGYDEIRPTKWGLRAEDDIITVFQGMQFMDAWIEGHLMDKRNLI